MHLLLESLMKNKLFILLLVSTAILTGCSSPQDVESDTVSQVDSSVESLKVDVSEDEMMDMFDSLSDAYVALIKSALSNQSDDVITQYAEILILVGKRVENKLSEDENNIAEYLLMYAKRNSEYANAVLDGDSEKQGELLTQIDRITNTLSNNYFNGYMPDSILSLKAEVEEMREREAEEKKKTEEEEKKKSEEAEKAKEKEDAETESISSEQSRAKSMAQRYLRTMSFSKSELKNQLVFEGFNDFDAQWAVDNIDADWNEQAVKKAEDYTRLMDMSNQGLYDQLIFDGFTSEQARHGIDNMKD